MCWVENDSKWIYETDKLLAWHIEEITLSNKLLLITEFSSNQA